MRYLQLTTSPHLSHIMAPNAQESRVVFGLCGVAAWAIGTQITDAPERRMCYLCNREERRNA